MVAQQDCPDGVHRWAVWNVGLSLWTALCAAGSTGMLSHGLRHVLTWCCIGVILFVAWPHVRTVGGRIRLSLAYGLVAVSLTPLSLSSSRVVNVLTFLVVLALLTATQSGRERSALSAACRSLAIFAAYRFLMETNPYGYLLAGDFCAAVSAVASTLAGTKLDAGPSLVGMDQAVLFVAWYSLWFAGDRSGQCRRRWLPLAVGFAAHGAYLLLLPHLAKHGALTAAEADWQASSLAAFLHWSLPWHMPAVLSLVYCSIASWMTSESRWQPQQAAVVAPSRTTPLIKKRAVVLCGVGAVIWAALGFCYPHESGLHGKRIVVNREGFLNWNSPEHGDYGSLSVGMYGMLPDYLASLGADLQHTVDYSEVDLEDADLLLLIYPDRPWEEGQLRRIWSFVERGGGLLVLGEHTVRESEPDSRINQVLEPFALRLRFDSSMFKVGGWLMSYDTLAHPVTIGIRDERNQLGFVVGATLDVRPPARPLVVGRWGWADPGDVSTPAMMGNGVYDPGEKLGDLVLAAEQRFGDGRVALFGDTSAFTNGLVVGTHDFISRVLAYMASTHDRGRLDAARYGAGAALWLVLTLLLWFYSSERMVLAWCAGLVTMVIAASAWTYDAKQVLPDGHRQSSRPVAYVDASHNHAHSLESWRQSGVMGLCLTLMRNGYLVFTLPTFDEERLSRADVLVIVAPQKEYGSREIAAVRKFVERGGRLVITVGYDDSVYSASLLADLDFAAAEDNTAPVPMGFFKAPYLHLGSQAAYVRFHAGWPVSTSAANSIARVRGYHDQPVIFQRRLGDGHVVFVGDSSFAMNKNLEREDGQPFEGERENAHFWRWLLTVLKNETPWYPPPIAPTGERP